MKQDATNIMETIDLPDGLVVDMDEGWPKLVSRQFGGDPGRAFQELIQNLLDSYPRNTPGRREEERSKLPKRAFPSPIMGKGLAGTDSASC